MRHFFLIGIVLFLLASCKPKEDPFIGRWTVVKVNVEFDVDWATPEMVRQFGSMEKNNVIIISADSVLTLVMDGDTMQSRCSLRGNRILCDGEPWGWYEEGNQKLFVTAGLGGLIPFRFGATGEIVILTLKKK